MSNDASIVDQYEIWHDLVEFPGYSVSNWGRVLNTRTGVCMKTTRNSNGVPIVGLMKNTTQHKRSLALLVATAFVPHQNESFDTPINLDGDRLNNHADNLMWRPLWFARKYTRQFTDNHATIDAPIEDVETRVQYENSMAAAVTHGLLDTEIYIAMMTNTYVWPTGQIFRKVE